MLIADVLKCVRPRKVLCFTQARFSLQYACVYVPPCSYAGVWTHLAFIQLSKGDVVPQGCRQVPGGICKMLKPGDSLTPGEMSLVRYIIHSLQGTGLNLWASKMLFENLTPKNHLKYDLIAHRKFWRCSLCYVHHMTQILHEFAFLWYFSLGKFRSHFPSVFLMPQGLCLLRN